MKFEHSFVASETRVVSCARILVRREVAAKHGAVPSSADVDQAKAQFLKAELYGLASLIDAVRAVETAEDVLGYFGFTFDRDRLQSTPLQEGETMLDRGMKIMRLPHPQWGNRLGTATVLDELVHLAADPNLAMLSAEHRAVLNEATAEGAAFFSQATSSGSS
ncbi:MAG: hypothetical protein KBE09_01495 [Candidatus Pacebacteria bacterium]|nr:hypothetical protein [Candidatus Paceibacterota bacterium]